MTRINLGKILATLEGEHDSTRAYDKYCEVSSNGSYYVSKKAVPVGTPITDTAFWQKRGSKGADGQDGTDGNDAYQPFKGWFNSASDLNTAFASPQVGDYAYVKGATASDPTTIYECTTAGTWALSQREFNPANNQSFASGEELNTTSIVDGLTSTSPTDVLSAKQGKVLNEKVVDLWLKTVEVIGEEGLELTITQDITQGTAVSSSTLHDFQEPLLEGKEYTIELKSGTAASTIAIYMRDADGNGVPCYWDGNSTTYGSRSFTSEVRSRTVVPTKDITKYAFYVSSSQAVGNGTMTFEVSRQGTSGLKERIEQVETEQAELNDKVEQLEDELNEKTGQLEEDLTALENELTIEDLSDITLNTLSGHYDYSNGNIVTSSTTSRYLIYNYFEDGAKVKVVGTVSNSTKPIYIGYAEQMPANGVALLGVKSVTESSYTEYINVPSGCYLCVLRNSSYHNIPTTSVVTEEKISEIAVQVRTSLDDNRRRMLAAMYDDRILDVEYSVISPTPGNTMAHFSSCYDRGFRAFKADMRLTADGKIVLCHDSGYTLNGSGQITTYNADNNTPIHLMTFDDILALVFASDNSVHPCSLEEFILWAKQKKVVPYITLRNEYISETVAEMYRVLQKYKMEDKVIINLFPSTANLIAGLYSVKKDWLICDTRYQSDTFNTSLIDTSTGRGCTYICLWDSQMSQVTDELILYAASKGIRIWNIITSSNDASVIMGKGITGFQNYTWTPVTS